MDIGMFLLFGFFLTLAALAIKPIRKSAGLLLVIVGTIASFTGIGLIIGIPLILVGGVLLFV